MTISTTSNTAVAQGNGLTPSFDFNFPVPLASYLVVYYTDADGVITKLMPSQYTVTGIGTANGGSVTYPTSGPPIAQGTSLTIQRVLPYQQLTDLVNQSGYYPNVVENALDYLTMLIQQLAEQVGLSIQVPLSADFPNLILPNSAGRALTIVGFDANGNVVVYPYAVSGGSITPTEEGPFINGVDFTAGVTASLPLSRAYGSPIALEVHFDAGYQGPDQYVVTPTQIIFNSPIPVGTNAVYIIGSAATQIGVPGTGTVGGSQLAYPASGPSVSRPTPGFIGQPYFDTTLGLPITAKQISPTVVWVAASGVAV